MDGEGMMSKLTHEELKQEYLKQKRMRDKFEELTSMKLPNHVTVKSLKGGGTKKRKGITVELDIRYEEENDE